MFTIRNQYGENVAWTSTNYDMTCRIAHYLRKLDDKARGYENDDCHFFVVSLETGRAISEVTEWNPDLDAFAYGMAEKLWRKLNV